MGPKPVNDLASDHCAGGRICTARSEMSWPTMSPATWSHARSTPTRWAVRPTATTSSTSQSTVSLPTGISLVGPAMQLGNLVNTAGSSGTSRAPSATCRR